MWILTLPDGAGFAPLRVGCILGNLVLRWTEVYWFWAKDWNLYKWILFRPEHEQLKVVFSTVNWGLESYRKSLKSKSVFSSWLWIELTLCCHIWPFTWNSIFKYIFFFYTIKTSPFSDGGMTLVGFSFWLF